MMHAGTPPRLWPLLWPIYLELCLGIGVGVFGTLQAAQVSDAAGAAFALSNQLAAALFVLFRIIGAGASVVITQRLGAGAREAADAVARATLGASTWLGGLTGLAASLLALPLLNVLRTPADVLPLALPFVVWLGPAMLLDAWNASLASILRSHLRGRDCLFVIVLMHGLHLALMQPLMHGWGGWPGLGLPGFAAALLVSRLFGLAVFLLWLRHGLGLGLRLALPHWWRLPRAELAALLHIGLPGAAENIAWRLCFTFSVAVAAGLGAQALATHAYVMQVMHGVLLFGAAAGMAVEIVVGHLVGAGQLRAANRLVRRTLAAGLLAATVLSVAAAWAAPTLLGLFTQDAAILAQGQHLLWLTVAVETGRIFNLVVINALRATGDARFPVLAGAGCMAVVLAGGSWLMGHALGWGLTGLWLAYAADEWLRGLIMGWRWHQLAWVPHARRARRQGRA